jgi:hypothetical protein
VSVSDTVPANTPAGLNRFWTQHWVGICATALILASETKFVLKDQVSAAGSSVDIYIASEVAIYALVGSYLVLRGKGAHPLSGTRPLELSLLAYVAYMAVSVPFAPTPLYSAIRVLEMLVLLLLIRSAIREGPESWFPSFVKAFILATAVLVVIGATLPHQRGPLQLERFNWLATHPVAVGQFLALALVASLVLAAAGQWGMTRTRAALHYWAAVALFSAALWANNTRGSAGAAAVGAAIGVALVVPRRILASGVLAFVYLASVAVLTSSTVLANWLARGEDAESLGALNSRLPLWRLAWSTVTESNPLFGLGLGASRSIFVDETGLGGAHNAALNVFVDLGVIGLLVWSWIIVFSTWLVVRRTPTSGQEAIERALWLSSMSVLVVNGATTEGLGGVANVGVGWFVVLVGRAAQIDREQHALTLTPAQPPRPSVTTSGTQDRTGS